MAEIESLEINVSANVDSAVSSINKLASAIRGIKGSSEFEQSINSIVNGFRALKDANVGVDVAGLSQKLSGISNAVKSFKVGKDFKENVELFVDAMNKFNGINANISGLVSALVALENLPQITDLLKGFSVNKDFEKNATAFADGLKALSGISPIGSSVSESVNALELLPKATEIIQGFNVDKSFESNAAAFAEGLKAIGSIQFDNSDDLQDKITKLFAIFDALNRLKLEIDANDIKAKLQAITQAAKSLAVDSSFKKSIDTFVKAIESINKLNDIDFAGINYAINAISRMPDVISALGAINIDDSFKKNIDSVVRAFNKFGKIEGLEEFASRIAGFKDAIEKVNSIDFGDSTQRILQAAMQLSSASNIASNFDLGRGFIENIDRVERASKVLNGIDFSGFREMSEVFASLPENMHISFGASQTELRDINDLLAEITANISSTNEALMQLNDSRANRSSRRTSSTGTTETAQTSNAETTQRPEWYIPQYDNILRDSSALVEQQNYIRRTLEQYSTLGENAPRELQRIAEVLGVINNSSPTFSWQTEEIQVTAAIVRELEREYDELQKIIALYEQLGRESEIPQVYERSEQIRASLGIDNRNAQEEVQQAPDFSWRTEEVRAIQESYEEHQRELSEIQRVIRAYEEMGQTAPREIRRIVRELENVNSHPLENAGKAIGKFSAAVAKISFKTVFAPLTAVSGTISKVVKKLGTLWNSLKRIAMYRAIRTAIKAITDGLSEGRKNLYQYSLVAGTEFAPSMDKAATSALYLKNSIGAATAPLTNYFVPILDKVVDKIVDVINAFNEMTAALTGAETWTRALKYPTQWQEAADDANASAKKLKSTLLGFDELNVIEPPNDSSKSSGFTADDYANMFEEVRTAYEMPETLGEIIQPIKLAWDNEGQNTLDSIKQTWESILALVHSVGESFKTVWTNGTGQKSLELILQITQEIVGTFGELADRIRLAWEENEKGTKIIQSAWNIVNNVLTFFRDIWSSTREWVQGLDFNPLFESLNEILAVIEDITSPTSALSQTLKMLWNDIILPIGKFVIETLLPKLVSLAAKILKLANTIAQKLQPALKWVTDNLIKPAGSLVGTTLGLVIDGLGDLVDLIDKLANGENIDLSDNLSLSFWKDFSFSNFAEWWETGARDMFGENTFAEDFVANFTENWESGIKTIIDYFNQSWSEIDWTSGFGDTVGGFYYDLEHELELVGEKACDVLVGIIETFKSTVDSVSIWWAKFWEGVGIGLYDILSGAFTTIKTISEQRINSIKTSFKKAGDNIEKKWTTTKTALLNGWENIKNKVTETKQHFIDKFEEIKTTITEKWETLKSNLKSGWDSVKEKIDDFARKWLDGFETIKTYVSDGIKNAKEAVMNSAAWKFFEGIGEEVAKFFDDGLLSIPEKIGLTLTHVLNAFKETEFWKFFSGIGEKISTAFSTAFETISTSLSTMFTNITTGIRSFLTTIFGEELVGGVEDKVKGVLNGVIGKFETAINWIIKGVNFFIGLFNEKFGSLKIEIPSVLGGGSIGGFEIPYLSEFNFYKFEKGGFPPKGQLFIANEAGAEMVGKMNNHTAVVNNQQIVDGVAQGVYTAVVNAMNTANSGDDDKHYSFNIYLDGRQLTAAVEATQRNRGISIMSGVAYT